MRLSKIIVSAAQFVVCAASIFILLAAGANGQVLNVWPGPAPGSENWKQKERTFENTPVGTIVINVVTPTLTAYLPDKSKATGTCVIIAPGGAFVALAISLEATDLARRLQARGIAAFVLKYRTIEKNFDGIPAGIDMDEVGKYGIADGIQALKVVRRHAAEYGISPDKVGFIGFSAGAMVASSALMQTDAAARPAFAAMIYGGPLGKMPAIPAKLPPMFMAWAQDDNVAREPIVKFYDALLAAGHNPETHIYSSGGHGFGMKKQGTTSDHWLDDLDNWMETLGLTKRR
ncbi:MAG: alpha/beta hydrolase [Acidobacteriota bacterium]